MKERWKPEEGIGAQERSRRQYFASPQNIQHRRRLAKYFFKPLVESVDIQSMRTNPILYEVEKETLDIERLLCETLGLKDGMTIADFGCGDATLLAYVLMKYDLQGRFIGMDQNADNFADNAFLMQEYVDINELDAILDFYEHNFDKGPIPLDDDSCDVSVAGNITYHLADPVSFLREVLRVTRDGGYLVAQEKGDYHHIRMWEKNPSVAAVLRKLPDHEDIMPPALYYNNFDIEASEHFLGSWPQLTLVDSIPQIGKLWIPKSGRVDVILGSFSLGSSFEPRGVDLGSHLVAIEETLMPSFDTEVAKFGHYTEFMHTKTNIYKVNKRAVLGSSG